MHAAFHLVCLDYLVQPGGKFLACQADIEGDCLCPLVEPRQVLLQKDQHPIVQADALPDAISDQVATIEHRHLRLVAREKLAVYKNQDMFIALVVKRIVCAPGHLPTSIAEILTHYMPQWAGVSIEVCEATIML